MKKELSEREKKVMCLVSKGWTDKEIALNLGIALRTVSAYVWRVKIKLDAKTRAQAVVLYDRSKSD